MSMLLMMNEVDRWMRNCHVENVGGAEGGTATEG